MLQSNVFLSLFAGMLESFPAALLSRPGKQQLISRIILAGEYCSGRVRTDMVHLPFLPHALVWSVTGGER